MPTVFTIRLARSLRPWFFGAAICMGCYPGGRVQILEVGQTAPDFELVGATRFGVLQEPVRLSDFRGKIVVLAFYYRARTPG